VRYLKFKPVGFVDPAMAKKARNYVTIFVIITMVPSIYLAYSVVQESLFKNRALGFVQEFVEENERQVIRTDLTYKSDTSSMEVAVIGKPLSANDQLRIREKLKK